MCIRDRGMEPPRRVMLVEALMTRLNPNFSYGSEFFPIESPRDYRRYRDEGNKGFTSIRESWIA